MTTSDATLHRERSERLWRLYTGAVANILDELSYRNQCLPANIRSLDRSMEVAGPVYTVRGLARHAENGVDPRYMQVELLEDIIPGSLVVVYPGDECRAAHWGELMSKTARGLGATGMVHVLVNGTVAMRDGKLTRARGGHVLQCR